MRTASQSWQSAKQDGKGPRHWRAVANAGQRTILNEKLWLLRKLHKHKKLLNQ
jgi:hypothetical protein